MHSFANLPHVEGDNRMWLRVMALLCGLAGGLYLVAALRER